MSCFSPEEDLLASWGVGGSCQDWTCRDGTGVETRVCKPRVLSFMLSEVKGKSEAQPIDSSWQDRANMLWRSRQAGSESQMVGYLETRAPAGRKVILVLKKELSHFWLPDCFW